MMIGDDRKQSFKIFIFSYNLTNDDILSHIKNIAVQPWMCLEHNCQHNCHHAECELCPNCLSEGNLKSLYRAYREQMRRGGFRRIFPSLQHFENDFVSKMTPKNKISAKWFDAKCENDLQWC